MGFLTLPERSNAAPPPGYSLVWSEEFNENLGYLGFPPTPALNGWGGFTGTAPEGWSYLVDSNFSTYESPAIIADPDAFGGKAMQLTVGNSNGALEGISLGPGSMLYGYVEIRAKVPSGQGLWPAFFLGTSSLSNPPYNLTTTWPENGEIDVMDIYGGTSGTNHGGIYMGHHANPTTWTTNYTLPQRSSFSQGYHIFGVLWTQTDATLYVDGVAYLRHTSMEAGWALNHPLDMAFSFNVGGKAGPLASTVALPQYCYIDYIRQYSGPQANSPNGGPQMVDPLNNLFFVYNTGGNVYIDNSNPTYFGGDTGRAAEFAPPQGMYLNYKYPGISKFSVNVYNLGLTDGSAVTAWYSQDHGQTYTQAAASYTSRVPSGGGWGKVTVTNNGSLPSGVTDLKISVAGTATGTATELSQVTILHAMTPVVPLTTITKAQVR
jgi:beta-glucanase (GH16 family)